MSIFGYTEGQVALRRELAELQDRICDYESRIYCLDVDRHRLLGANAALRGSREEYHTALRVANDTTTALLERVAISEESYRMACERADDAALQANDEGNRADEAERRAETMRLAFEEAMEQAERLAFALRFFGGDPEAVMGAT